MLGRFRLPRSFSDQVVDDAVDYFSTALRSTSPSKCPDRQLLRRLAASSDLVKGDIRAHLFQCSECFAEFRREKLAHSERGTRRLRPGLWLPLHVASVVAVFVLLVAALWPVLNETGGRQESWSVRGAVKAPANEASRSAASPVVVAVRLSALQATRGGLTVSEPNAGGTVVPAAPVRLIIDLPPDSDDAEYEVAVVSAFDRVLTRARTQSAARRLIATIDGSQLPAGQCFLRVGSAGHPPDYVPITVVRP